MTRRSYEEWVATLPDDIERVSYLDYVFTPPAPNQKVTETDRVEARISGGITDDDLEDYLLNWLPKIDPKCDWSWPRIRSRARLNTLMWGEGCVAQGSDESIFPSRCYCLHVAGKLEGMMALSYDHRSAANQSLEPPDQEHVVYVDFLLAAPWNVKGVKGRRYMGVGESLIRHAVWESLNLGWRGLVGLHSLDDHSSAFYGKLGMEPLFFDTSKGMPYFEFASRVAWSFYSRQK